MIIELLQSLVLGITGGFSEWLPIGSDAHFLLVGDLLGARQNAALFSLTTALISIGSAVAVISLYTGRLLPFLFRSGPAKERAGRRLWFKLLLASIPAIIPALIKPRLAFLGSPYLTGVMVILTGLLLLYADRHGNPSWLEIDKVSRITPKTAFLIGCGQLLTLLPGTSRTTCVIAAALLLGCSRRTAAEFAFFLGVPMVFFGALRQIFYFIRHGEGFGLITFPAILLGGIAAYFAAVYSIRFLQSRLKDGDYTFFVLYRAVLGIVILSYFIIYALMR